MFSLLLDSLPEPKISCNTSDSELVLNCIAHFPGSLNYAWKLSNDPHSYPTQELSISWKNVDATTKATCIIKFSQTERSSEISLNQCRPEEKGNKYVMLPTQVWEACLGRSMAFVRFLLTSQEVEFKG